MWVSLLCATTLILDYAADPKQFRSTLFLNLLAVGFSALLAWRSSETLNSLAVTGIAVTLAVASGRNFSRTAFARSITQYIQAFVDTVTHAMVGFLLLIGNEIQWRKSSEAGVWRHLRTVLTGFLIALPFLVIFACLFSSADAVFETRLKAFLLLDLESLVANSFYSLLICWGTAGYLRKFLLVPEQPPRIPSPQKPWFTSAELNIALVCVNILFLSFVIIQIEYLFGGSNIRLC